MRLLKRPLKPMKMGPIHSQTVMIIITDRTNCFISENEMTELTKSQIDLKLAIEKFESNYLKFVKTHTDFITIQDDFRSAMQLAQQETNIYRSAELFRKEISQVLSVRTQKETLGK